MIYCKYILCYVFIVVVAESLVLLLLWLLILLLLEIKFNTWHHHTALSSTNHNTLQRPKKVIWILLEACHHGVALCFSWSLCSSNVQNTQCVCLKVTAVLYKWDPCVGKPRTPQHFKGLRGTVKEISCYSIGGQSESKTGRWHIKHERPRERREGRR